MDRDAQSSAKSTIDCGLIAAAMGVFFILFAAGVIQLGPTRAGQEPGWVGVVCGLIFLLGGSAVVFQTVASDGKTPQGQLPASTPRWLRAVNQLICLAIVVSMGALGTWVAFGPGERQFTGSGSFLGQIGGRIAFGIGAALIWIVLAAAVFVKIRRLVLRR